MFVGVDRLDYIKGLPQKLHAFELFLESNPEYQKNVVLIQVAVPSRLDVQEYSDLKKLVNELVGRINGQYGDIEFMPIHLINKSVAFEEMVALFSIADACVVSSPRDGMNLVSYEYISCQHDKNGVLILSEFAGSAQSLSGSIIVNPWNTKELATAMKDSLCLSAASRKENHVKLCRYVQKVTSLASRTLTDFSTRPPFGEFRSSRSCVECMQKQSCARTYPS